MIAAKLVWDRSGNRIDMGVAMIESLSDHSSSSSQNESISEDRYAACRASHLPGLISFVASQRPLSIRPLVPLWRRPLRLLI